MILISVLTYQLGKELGIQGAARELARQLADPVSYPAEHLLPVVRTITRFRSVDDLSVYHGASTTLTKARSRAAHAALGTECDLWAMIDDDVETDLETLRRLVAIARSGRVAVLPCALRSTATDHRVNVVWDSPLVSMTTAGSVPMRSVRRGGCGLMIVPRVALERVRDEYRSELEYTDDDDVQRVALFAQVFSREERDGVSKRFWLGEDYSFCNRLRSVGVEIAAPIEGTSAHDGVVLDLAEAARL